MRYAQSLQVVRIAYVGHCSFWTGAMVTNASGSEKLHRILHRLLASGAYGRLLAALSGINGSD
jgi:hypothetical protein